MYRNVNLEKSLKDHRRTARPQCKRARVLFFTSLHNQQDFLQWGRACLWDRFLWHELGYKRWLRKSMGTIVLDDFGVVYSSSSSQQQVIATTVTIRSFK